MKTSKLLLFSAVLVLAGLSTNAVAQPPSSGIGITIWAEYFGTDDVAEYAIAGDQVDYFAEVYLISTQYPIYSGEPNLTLPNGTYYDLANNLTLASGASITYGPYPYTINLSDLGQLPGATPDSVRARAGVWAMSDRPSIDQRVNSATNWDILVFQPEITLTKYADTTTFCEGDEPEVTYTFEVYNSGNEDIDSDVYVIDSECGQIAWDALDYTGDDGDGYLNPGETWTVTCQQTLTDTTTNYAYADGFGRYTGEYVYAEDDWTVTATPPPGVDVDPESAEICEGGDPVELCAVVTGGVGPFTYLWSPGGAITQCINVNAAGTYTVTVTDEGTDCDASDSGTLTVNEKPSCILEAVAAPVCPSTGGNLITAAVTGGSGVYTDYLWEITAGAGWDIVGGQGTDTVEYSVSDVADECATFNLTVTDDEGCETTCDIEVCCTGDTYCTFTQGFYGNAGGTACGGKTTTELINEALGDPVVPVVVGVLGERSITFSSAADIILRLPCSGKPSALPAVNVNAHDQSALEAAKLVKKKGDTINNVLVGQVVALTLNLRVSDGCIEDSGDLSAWTLPDEFCIMGEDLCAEKFTIPVSVQGKTVAQLIDLANAALAGDTAISISDIYTAVTNLNEGFDECATIIACPTEEICNNGCDDDFDGDTDCEDGDCSGDPACAI